MFQALAKASFANVTVQGGGTLDPGRLGFIDILCVDRDHQGRGYDQQPVVQ